MIFIFFFVTKSKKSPSGQVRYASQANGAAGCVCVWRVGGVMEHAHHRSSFNTDEHHYCSSDNEILKEESAFVIPIIKRAAASSSMPLWSIVVFDGVFVLSSSRYVTSLCLVPSADPYPGGLECSAL